MASSSDVAPTVERLAITITSQLKHAASGMDTVIGLVKEGYTDYPMEMSSALVPDNDAARKLKDIRSHFTRNLVLYKNRHLPLSKQTVTNLSDFLDLVSVDFDEFLMSAVIIHNRLDEYYAQADAVRELHLALETDMQLAYDGIAHELKVVNESLAANAKEAKNKETQSKVAIGVGGVLLTAGVVTGTAVACALIGPAGLFAPALAAPALGAGVGVGTGAAALAINWSQKLGEEARRLDRALSLHQQAANTTEATLPVALKKFAECLSDTSAFFLLVKQELSKMRRNAGDFKSPVYKQEELRILHGMILRQAAKLKDACSGYLVYASQIEVPLRLVEKYENENHISYIDEWFTQVTTKSHAAPKFKKNCVKEMFESLFGPGNKARVASAGYARLT